MAMAALAAAPPPAPTLSELLDRAHAMHERLEQIPIAQRRPAQYEAIADLLTEVWKQPEHVSPSQDVDPTPAEVALFDDGGVHVAMAQDLRDASGWTEAAYDYRQLLRRFPGTRFRRNAEWALAQVEWFHLGQRARARRRLADFLRRYPADARAHYAQRQLRGRRIGPPAILPPDAREASSAAKKEEKSRPISSGAGVAEQRIPASGKTASSLPASAEPALDADPPAGSHPPPSPPGPVRVSGLQWHTEPRGLTLVLSLSGRPDFTQERVPETHTVYFDFSDAHFTAGMANRFIHLTANPVISEIELARNRPGVIRLAVHERAGHPLNAVAMYFPNPSRLVVSLRPRAGGAASPPLVLQAKNPAAPARSLARRPAPARSSLSAPPLVVPARRMVLAGRPLAPAIRHSASAAPVPAPKIEAHPGVIRQRAAAPLPSGAQSISRALGLKVRRIVIDAGHGGFDTGAIGPNGLDEKTVTLSIALRLGRLLHDRLGEQVIYTRRTDVFVPLQTRTAIANAAHADLFISIHANSSDEPEVAGVEAYYLNLTRSPRALEVAARENDTSELGDYDLRALLKSIAQNDKRQESELLCADIDHSLAQGLDETNRGVKSAPFIVLIGAHMPSVLAEVSFLSNPHYARLLAHGGYRQRIALALFHGIAKYIHSLGGAQSAPASAGQ